MYFLIVTYSKYGRINIWKRVICYLVWCFLAFLLTQIKCHLIELSDFCFLHFQCEFSSFCFQGCLSFLLKRSFSLLSTEFSILARLIGQKVQIIHLFLLSPAWVLHKNATALLVSGFWRIKSQVFIHLQQAFYLLSNLPSLYALA